MSLGASPNAQTQSRGTYTRELLIQTGRIAFANKGLTGTNLRQDILDPAGVSVGSFYHQFRDKTELLLEILKRDSEALRDMVSEANRPRPGRPLTDMTRIGFGLVFDMADAVGDALRIRLQERSCEDERVRDLLKEERGRWVDSLAEDYDRLNDASGQHFDARLAAGFTLALCVGVLQYYLEATVDERPEMRERLLGSLVQFTIGGIPAVSPQVTHSLSLMGERPKVSHE
jgi:AcrR family transcriptional regulator